MCSAKIPESSNPAQQAGHELSGLPSRRSLMLGAGFAVAAQSLVRAESMLDIPGNPHSRHGLLVAKKWAAEEFSEKPGCRVVYADGQATRWHHYDCVDRPAQANASQRTYAVAIEVCVTDQNGKRYVTSVPVDGVASVRAKQARISRAASSMTKFDWMMS